MKDDKNKSPAIQRYNKAKQDVETVRKTMNNPKLFNQMNPLQRLRAKMVVESADYDEQDPIIRETVNEIANRIEMDEQANDQLMRGLVTPEEHKKIMKRTQMRKQQFEKIKQQQNVEIPREGVRQHTEFARLLKQDKSKSPEEKRQLDMEMRKLIEQETRGKLKKTYEMEDQMRTEGEFTG